MPAKIHRNVRSKVHRALFQAALEHLLAQADDYMEADPLLEGPGFINAPKAAIWTVEAHRLGVSYVRARIRFTDDTHIDRAWKIPKNGLGLSKGVCGSLWTQNLPIDKYRQLVYPVGARGGAVVAGGRFTKHSTRNRPAIGRAFKRRR